MQNLIMDAIESFGYLGVLLLITLENVFPPIPSEVVLTFAGFMTKHTSMTAPLVIVSATIGSVLGAIVLYLVGRLLSTERLERLVSGRVGRLLHFKPSDIVKAERWFKRRGNSAVFFCRFIPIVRSLISIPAGTTKMPFGRFVLLSAAGTAVWNIVLVYFGRAAGHAWSRVAGYFDTYAFVALIVLVLVFIAGVAIFYKRRFKTQKLNKQ
ncbi:DedA family protein [Lacticaseibacillus zhaodongensis]|uniref:DedA family protein n=1 Tax=Lacticaseibacillus zhaodongensis TaxID=2668065 RepID=UPI0012D33AF9|nr:DedA family protein [Lacticaseibacillus zhaodongensis]